jgi:hypothetical protein
MSESKPVKLKVCCEHLRHKMMYVDERHAVRGLVDDSSDTRVYFCSRNHESLGTDGLPVSPADCTPDRACYKRA